MANYPIYDIVKHGRRWAVVMNYGNLIGSAGRRQGWWCEDAEGGWGTSTRSPEQAVRQCVRPITYKTKAAAIAESRDRVALWA